MWLRPAVWLALALPATTGSLACHSWEIQAATPRNVVEHQRPGKVKVWLADGSRYVLYRPHVAGDSLLGDRDHSKATTLLTDVDEIAVQRFSTGKTGLLILSFPAAIFVTALIGCAASGCGY
jgi:hypothetical protein